jgi:hypothetical protein
MDKDLKLKRLVFNNMASMVGGGGEMLKVSNSNEEERKGITKKKGERKHRKLK